jgi:hypothetical protein
VQRQLLAPAKLNTATHLYEGCQFSQAAAGTLFQYTGQFVFGYCRKGQTATPSFWHILYHKKTLLIEASAMNGAGCFTSVTKRNRGTVPVAYF